MHGDKFAAKAVPNYVLIQYRRRSCDMKGITMNSKITKAVVFLQGAEITRTTAAKLVSGRNEIRLAGLPECLVSESITAEISGPASLVSVVTRIAYLNASEASGEAVKLQKELDACETGLEEAHGRLEILKEDASFLRDNRRIGGKQGLNLLTLQEMSEYYHKRLTELMAERLAALQEQKELEAKKERLLAQLETFRSPENRASAEIIVEAACEKECEVQITISYFVPCAGWNPSYEIRVKDAEHPPMLIYKAEIRQSTGEDWNDIPLILSTGQPALNGNPPELRPWYVDAERNEPSRPSVARKRSYLTDAVKLREEEVLEDEIGAFCEEETDVPFSPVRACAETSQSCISMEFALPGTVSIDASGNGQKAEIRRCELKADYRYYCVPKLNPDVFLMAEIRGWEELDFVEGEAGVFLGNTYIGSAYLDPRKADETLKLSLGRDKGVIVLRENGKEFAGRAFMGGNRQTTEWQITIRNMRHTGIELKVLDQIPVSVNKAVTVEPEELSGALLNPDTGELCWEKSMEPGESIRLTVRCHILASKKVTVHTPPQTGVL